MTTTNEHIFIKTFIVGETYECRSICDSDTIFKFKVVSRTKQTMMISYAGKVTKRGIYLMAGEEHCRPMGTFSMCPVIRASDLKDPEAAELKQQLDREPTWEETVACAIAVLECSSHAESRATAREEIFKAARLADAYVATLPARKAG